jgi:iron complex transport system ATP-binding protein
MPQSIVNLSNVNYRRNGSDLLQGINWQVKKGEHWAVLGPNGSGKTTLLQLLNGYIWPSSGDIHVLNRKLGTIDVRELRQKIGWLSSSILPLLHQHNESWKIVVTGKFGALAMYEEIQDEDRERAFEILSIQKSEHLACKPFGLLSQGEKQKVLMCRALMANPELLIMDEACTGLDIRAREDLLTHIAHLCSSPEAPTIIYVTHHTEEIIPSISKALLISEGKVIAQGDKEDTLKSSVLSKIFGLPIQLEWVNERPWTHIMSSR